MLVSNSINALLRPVLAAAAATTIFALSACGGGGGDGDKPSGGNDTPTSGSVAVLFRDAPTDDFCEVRATIQAIDLLNAGGSMTNIFTGPETVDLLSMRNYTDFFSVDPVVPIGSYEKVRMTLSDLALVECDASGKAEPESGWEHPSLPGNGKLDLNPRGTFEVVGGEMLVIELDMDMNKSLHAHQTGNGKWQFRPVVFVTIKPDSDHLVRVFGKVQNFTNGTFELCPVEPVSSMDNDSPGPGTECIDVVTDGKTGVFGPNGFPGAVANDNLLTAIGFLDLHDDADGDSRMDDLRLSAAVVEIGPQGTFERIKGAVVSAPGNNNLFVFDPTPLDAATNAIDVLLQSGTRIFAIGSSEELTSAALQPAARGEVDGVFTTAPTGEPLKSSLIVLDVDATPDVVLLDAVIKTIPADDDAVAETRRLTVDTTALTGKCVKTDAGTRYLKITESASSTETAEVVFSELAVNDKIDVYGSNDTAESACVLADTIQKYVTAP